MKAKFTGHDTFPLRYGWLFKAVNYLNNNGKFTGDESINDAIVQLGVGKNMVKAIQYWAESVGVIKSVRENSKPLHAISERGDVLFNIKKTALDPYLEHSCSVWLIHYWLCSNTDSLTAYRYFFNYSNVQHFEKTKLIDDCFEELNTLVTTSVEKITTIKKDFDCFLNTYARKNKIANKKNSKVDEDHFVSPLSELKLIIDNGNGFYISNLESRPDLPVAVFAYALLDFFNKETKESKINTIDFDSLLTKPYSPGRIFRLSEAGLSQKLDELQQFTNKKIAWLDSLGLRQIQVADEVKNNGMKYVNDYYNR
ncbi:DUF4007 family protein [Pseudoalteromonas sp. BZB3]|uniref:DUF4007 family protein n=1 Tax=Pseudoalteromonas sp. BZB3 TaxID=3136670 RepID=UPI0032C4019A